LIFSNSRYAEGAIFKAHNPQKKNYSITVLREFPSYSSEFFYYTWTENDRIDMVANKFLGSPDVWWELLDINPEIIDPFDIPIGTALRIPNE
jgi:prophage DNA circulation protein